MRKSRGSSYAVIAAAAAAAVITAHAHAATVTWNDATPPGDWSDAANWTGGAGVPAAADSVVFGNVGAAATQGSVTNVVNQNFTLVGLLFNQQADLQDTSTVPPTPTPKFHTTQIDAGVTLTLNGNPSTGILHVGSRDNAATAYSVYTTFTGGGTLTLNNTSATADIRQGSSAGSFTGRATLDLAGLSNFSANVSNFRIGNGEGSSTTFNRSAGTVILAPTSTITAGTVITGFVSASGAATSQLTLNTNTTINANNFQFGIRKGSGNANFAAGVTGGTLVVRSQTGTGRANLDIAQAQASETTANSASGTLDFTSDGATRGGGSVDMLLGNLNIARGNANAGTATQGRGVGRLTYDAGIVDANEVTVGEAGSAAGKGTSTGTLEVLGTGQLRVNNNLTLAKNTVAATGTGIPTGTLTIGGTGASASARIVGGLNDGGGITTVNVTSASLNAGTIGSAASPVDTLNLNSGKLTVNLDTAAATANITALNADGTNKLGVNVTGVVAAGLYPVVDYGTLGGAGGFASITLDKLPARMVATLQDSGSTLDLNVSSYDSPKWKGNGSSDWTVNGPQNWLLIAANTATAYQEDLVTYATADNVLFDDTADTGAVNIVGTVTPGSVQVNNAALNYAFGGSGAIAGGVGIVKSGGGTLTIANTGANAVGPITINAGTVQIGDNSTAGGGLGTYGAINNAGTLELNPAAGDTLNLGGAVISGAGAVNHAGAGKTTFAAGNTYTGTTNITAGTVMVTGNNSFGPISAGSAAVNISGTGAIDLANAPANLDFTTNKIFNVGSHGTGGNGAILNSGTTAIQNAFEKINLTADSTINLNARVDLRGTDSVRGNLNLDGKTLTKKGPGQFTIVRSDVTAGNIDVLEGTLRFETSSTATGPGLLSFAPGSTAQFQLVTGEISRPIALDGANVSDSNQTAASTIQSPITMTGENTFAITNSTGFTFSGNIGGAGGMTKTGGGTMALSGANTFTGKLAASGGKLDLLSNQAGSSSLEASGDAVIELVNDTTAMRVVKTGNVLITDTAKVDLKNNKLITDKPLGTFGGTSYSGIQGDIARAYNFGSWDQPGLTTSEDLADPTSGPLGGTTTLAVNKASEVLFIGDTDTATFAGQTVTGATTLAVYTYAGDVNLDGLVDAADYGVIDNWVQFPGTDGYMNGDFNYDGVIDAADYGIIDNTVQLQGAPIPMAGAAGAALASADAGLGGVTAVPEPASLSVVALAGASLLGRRRRRRRRA